MSPPTKRLGVGNDLHTCSVVTAAGYTYYKIARAVSNIRPLTAGTNEVDTYYEPTNLAPKNDIMMPESVQAKMASSQTVSTSPTFALQYGIRAVDANLNGQAWISSGSSLVGPIDGTAYEIINNSNEYAFMLTYANGQVFYYDYDATSFDHLLASSTSSSLRIAVVERTTNLVHAYWCPIYTNDACPMNEVMDFVDTNPPPVRGFYRLVFY